MMIKSAHLFFFNLGIRLVLCILDQIIWNHLMNVVTLLTNPTHLILVLLIPRLFMRLNQSIFINKCTFWLQRVRLICMSAC